MAANRLQMNFYYNERKRRKKAQWYENEDKRIQKGVSLASLL